MEPYTWYVIAWITIALFLALAQALIIGPERDLEALQIPLGFVLMIAMIAQFFAAGSIDAFFDTNFIEAGFGTLDPVEVIEMVFAGGLFGQFGLRPIFEIQPFKLFGFWFCFPGLVGLPLAILISRPVHWVVSAIMRKELQNDPLENAVKTNLHSSCEPEPAEDDSVWIAAEEKVTRAIEFANEQHLLKYSAELFSLVHEIKSDKHLSELATEYDLKIGSDVKSGWVEVGTSDKFRIEFLDEQLERSLVDEYSQMKLQFNGTLVADVILEYRTRPLGTTPNWGISDVLTLRDGDWINSLKTLKTELQETKIGIREEGVLQSRRDAEADRRARTIKSAENIELRDDVERDEN